MLELFKVLMISMLTSNVVFSLPYGVCSYLGVSKSKKSSIGMGFALTFVTILASVICYLINMLLEVLSIEYMATICFILVVASVVQFVEMFIKKFSPSLYKSLGIYLPLITTNCVVLYVCKQVVDMDTLLGGLGLSNTIGGEFGNCSEGICRCCCRITLHRDHGNDLHEWFNGNFLKWKYWLQSESLLPF